MKKLKGYYMKKMGLLALFSILFVSCEKDASFRTFAYPEQTTEGISPKVGFPTQQVTIKGKDFGNLIGPVRVYFNGVQAETIVSCTDTEIVAVVPLNAVSGKVSLKIWTHLIDSIGTFDVRKLPVLESIESKGIAPNIAKPEDEVWLNGKNFLTDPSLVSIDFNGTPVLNILSLTENLIKVKAPSGYTAGPIHITMLGLTLTGTSLAPEILPGDVTGLFLKNFKQPFLTNMTDGQKGTTVNWATPANWTVNAGAQNQINSGATERTGGLNFGKADAKTTGQLILQAGYGDATANVLTNGKMYQTVKLPAGSYEFVTEVKEFGRNTNSHVYMLVTSGTDLPNTVDIPTSPTVLAYSEYTAAQDYNATPVLKKISFTLTGPTTVSLGLAGSMVANTYVRLNAISLILK